MVEMLTESDLVFETMERGCCGNAGETYGDFLGIVDGRVDCGGGGCGDGELEGEGG